MTRPLWSSPSLWSPPYLLILCGNFPHISHIFPLPLLLRICPSSSFLSLVNPLLSPPSPLALLLSSPYVRLLQAALLPPCLPHVLPLEDMHLGSCCTLLCVLINILAAWKRKWVFFWANPLWGGWLEQRKGKVIEEEGQVQLFYFFMPGIFKTILTNQMCQKVGLIYNRKLLSKCWI